MSDGELSERVVEPGPRYGDGEAVRVRIHRRGRRIDIDDDGRAWRKAGAGGGQALAVAQDVVAGDALNVNRRGTVFVPAVEGRDVDELATRVASCPVGVYDAVLELSG